MSKAKQAREILVELGLPPAQYNEMSCLTLLALAGIKPKDAWKNAKRSRTSVSRGIMTFVRENYRKKYAENTRETFRRQVLHQFVQAHLAQYNPFEPDLPTNSPRAHYALHPDVVPVLQAFGGPRWKAEVEAFKDKHGSLAFIYGAHRADQTLIAMTLRGGKKITMSPGLHNVLEKAVVEEFAPRFAPGAELLYLGDTAKKGLLVDAEGLQEVGFPVSDHDKLPDVVLFDRKRNWLYLVEAVTSHGPMTPKRLVELKVLLKKAKAGLIFVTAFPDRAEFRKHMADIAWETEVWLMDTPEHMIHFNGDRFFGPRESDVSSEK
jgi:hypothetical protein